MKAIRLDLPLPLKLLFFLTVLMLSPLYSQSVIFGEKLPSSVTPTPDSIDQNQPQKVNNPDLFETFQFGILSKLYISRDSKINWSYNTKLSQLIKPAGAFIKYTSANSVPGVIRFYNDQLWLGIFDKKVTKWLFFYIDDGFDGFIYEGEKNGIPEGGKGDGFIDRIAVMNPNGGGVRFLDFKMSTDKKTITFTGPAKKSFKIDSKKYQEYFKLTYIRLRDEEKKEFIPFNLNQPVADEFKFQDSFSDNKDLETTNF